MTSTTVTVAEALFNIVLSVPKSKHVRCAGKTKGLCKMEDDFALDGFKYAIQFTLDGTHERREGMRAMTLIQKSLLEEAVYLFGVWRTEQEGKLKALSCVDCKVIYEDSIQCLTCGNVFCDYHWIDHMDMSFEEDPESKVDGNGNE